MVCQIARQVVKLNPSDLCLPSRAWKVKLLGEGADDAGGVFDDTITEMCQVRQYAARTSCYTWNSILALYLTIGSWIACVRELQKHAGGCYAQEKRHHMTFVKIHQNVSIWPTLATFRANYRVLGF